MWGVDGQPGVLVNVGNEGWTLSDTAQQRNLQFSRLRAMEVGRPLVRVMNAGYSAVIGADVEMRRVQRRGEWNDEIEVVQPTHGVTPFVTAGSDLMAVIGMSLLLLAMLFFRGRCDATISSEVVR